MLSLGSDGRYRCITSNTEKHFLHSFDKNLEYLLQFNFVPISIILCLRTIISPVEGKVYDWINSRFPLLSIFSITVACAEPPVLDILIVEPTTITLLQNSLLGYIASIWWPISCDFVYAVSAELKKITKILCYASI